MSEIIDIILMLFKTFEEKIVSDYKKNKDQKYKHFKDEFLKKIANHIMKEKEKIESQKEANEKMIKEMKKHNVEATAYQDENEKLDAKKKELENNLDKITRERI